jgi:ubiquinone/menaquinone biosynthesis C-methylase UbiE
MRPRVFLGRLIIRLGGFIQSLAIMVMRPDDLVHFSRQTYSRLCAAQGLEGDPANAYVLNPDEKALLDQVPVKGGRLLLLGIGSGREAIPLVEMGYEVTGVDFVPELTELARANASKKGLEISCLVQEMSELDAPPDYYDLAWLSSGMYSGVPTSSRRVDMLKRIRRSLKPGGYLVFQFVWVEHTRQRPRFQWIRKAFAYVTLGNLSYEKGDILSLSSEFLHQFSSQEEVRQEAAEAGFEIVQILDRTAMGVGQAVLRRELL